MIEGFNLVYFHKETGEEYWVKRVSRLDFIIYDPRTKTKLPLSEFALRKAFRACPTNGKRQKKVKLDFRKRVLTEKEPSP
jgi:hypothetical protein